MRYLRLYNFPILFIFAVFLSCSSYSEFIIEYRVSIPKDIDCYFNDSGDEKKISQKKRIPDNLNISLKKYLVRGSGLKPESKIMNKAVEEALKGNRIEAEILFRELTGIINDGSVENNLAVIFESEKRIKEAANMYLNALTKSPENFLYRSNFLSFICQNRYNYKK